MEWNYDMDACPLDTRVEFLSGNERNTFEMNEVRNLRSL